MDGLKGKVWRKSHSLRSVRMFEVGQTKLEEYVKSQGFSFDEQVKALKSGSDVYKFFDDYISYLDSKSLKPKTIKDYVYWAKKILRYHGVQIKNEDFRERVSLPKVQRPLDSGLEVAQVRRILLNCKNERLKLLLMLCKDTLARPIELLGLQVKHFWLHSTPKSVIIPAYLAKNDVEREAFFTDETFEFLKGYMLKHNIQGKEDFIFLTRRADPKNELQFQAELHKAETAMEKAWRELLKNPALADLNERIELRGKAPRYRIHIYSFRKFSFTKVADTLGEMAAHAMAGHEAYMITYYRKPREERVSDYLKVAPKLIVLTQPQDMDELRKQAGLEAIRQLAKTFGIDPLRVRIEKETELGRTLTLNEEIETIQEEIRKFMVRSVRLKEGFDSNWNNGNYKRYESKLVSEDELPLYLDEGWDIVKELSDGKIAIRRMLP
jgi:integrase